MSFTDYYKELGVPKTATADEIKKSFRKLAREFHPDTNPDNPAAEERFKRISEAYDVLGDTDKRAKYDQLSSQYSQYQRTGQRPGGFGQQFNMDDVDGMFQGTSFGDLLSELFGQRTSAARGQARRAQSRPTPKSVYAVTLSLEEAFTGIAKRFTINEKKVDIAFKPGIASKQRLRIPDGEIEVAVQDHSRYTREGNDIHVHEHIAITTAVLGGKVDVRTLSGVLTVSVPAGSPSGKVLRLRGQGMPVYNSEGARGDLFVELHITVPASLSDEQRTLVESLRDAGL
ncbi:MAG: DnaJ C-terminal domain-containing protein [Ignavibacteria bacterium]|jgi:curved DNA-binding protein